MKKNVYINDHLVQLESNIKLNTLGKNILIKNYKQHGKMNGFIDKYFERFENDVNDIIFGRNIEEKMELKHLADKVDIKKFVEKLLLTNIMFQYIDGEIITTLYYSLPDYDKEIIIALNSKLKLKYIEYMG